MRNSSCKSILALLLTIALLIALCGCDSLIGLGEPAEDSTGGPADDTTDDTTQAAFEWDAISLSTNAWKSLVVASIPDASGNNGRKIYGVLEDSTVDEVVILDGSGQQLTGAAYAVARIGHDSVLIHYSFDVSPDGAMFTYRFFIYSISQSALKVLPADFIISEAIIYDGFLYWLGTRDPAGAGNVLYTTNLTTLETRQLSNPDTMSILREVLLVLPGGNVLVSTPGGADLDYVLVNSGTTATTSVLSTFKRYKYFYGPDDTLYAVHVSLGDYVLDSVSTNGAAIQYTLIDSVASTGVSVADNEGLFTGRLVDLGSSGFVEVTFAGDVPTLDFVSLDLSLYSSSVGTRDYGGGFAWWDDGTSLQAIELIAAATPVQAVTSSGIISWWPANNVVFYSRAVGVNTESYSFDLDHLTPVKLLDSKMVVTSTLITP